MMVCKVITDNLLKSISPINHKDEFLLQVELSPHANVFINRFLSVNLFEYYLNFLHQINKCNVSSTPEIS